MASSFSNQDDDCINVMPVEQLFRSDCNGSYEPDACDQLFSEPEVVPRIGDEFQVQIPSLIGESEYSTHYLHNFLVGLPVPCFSQKQETLPINTGTFLNEEKFEISYVVPGLCTEQWSDAEKASFLLGLYIFLKDFVEVRKFIESKEMGAILSFYYAEFYGSDLYRRWSDGQMEKGKKCVHGKKCIYGHEIFSGPRLQELQSRLLPTISEESRDALLEVFRRFSDEEMSLAEFVSSLKAMVGMHILVEAIGIGTGKRDLTGTAMESSSRSNRVAPTRPVIPTGKSCSNLSTSEIIKFISGDYRLSKGKSNDLFWEAVWPRLLARDWHSEQPKGQGHIANFKNNLVFLVPGVKKFSRRKLVKGVHYFDSVSDVLNKVAKEPSLIELDFDEDDGRKKVEVLKEERESEKDDEDSSGARPRHSYLQPRTPKRDTDVMSFTVVDTSLPSGKVRELRGFPTEILTSQKNGTKDSYEETDESESTKRTGEKTNLKSEKALHKVTEVSKSLLSEKLKRTNEEDRTAPIKKKFCKPASESCWAPRFENGMSGCSSFSSRTGSYQDKTSCASSSKGSPSESIECAPCNDIRAPEPQTCTFKIDLNVPQIPLELENHQLQNTSVIEAKSEQEEPVVNPRRRSTRTRPPTARALEAVADGLLTVNRRRKRKDGQELAPRPLQRVHIAMCPSESINSAMRSQSGEATNISKSNELSSSQGTEVNGDSISGLELVRQPALNELNFFL